MRYLLLIYDENTAGTVSAPPPTEAEMGQAEAAYNAFTQECRDRGVYQGGEALQAVNTATTVRIRDGKTFTTDGPFMETKEALGGYYLLDCRDLDEALEFAAKCPGSVHGSVEVRPVWDFSERVPEAPTEAGVAH